MHIKYGANLLKNGVTNEYNLHNVMKFLLKSFDILIIVAIIGNKMYHFLN